MAKATSPWMTMSKHEKRVAGYDGAAKQSENHDTTDKPGQQSYFPFLNLPAEIKNMIYRYCLVSKLPIDPHAFSHTINGVVVLGVKASDLALLHVCKSIATDAKKIFFSKNTWLLNQETLDLPVKSFWKQLLEQPHHPPLGRLYVFFDDLDLHSREALKLKPAPAKPVYNLRPTRSTAPVYAEPMVSEEDWKEYVREIFSYKIGVIRALLDKNLIAKGLTMNFEFCEFFDLILDSPRWFKDDMKTRSGRQIKLHAYAKTGNIFPAANVKFEPEYNGLGRESIIKSFKDRGFRGQYR
ncbi:MAG: hypothetical protein Q9228_005891 [Teloschistes exilis]